VALMLVMPTPFTYAKPYAEASEESSASWGERGAHEQTLMRFSSPVYLPAFCSMRLLGRAAVARTSKSEPD
jgi:hypothetical protein